MGTTGDPLGIDALRAGVDAITATPATSYDRHVPGCPGWAVADLVAHVGRVHRWVTAALDAPPDERVRYPADPGLAGADLRAWLVEGATDLIDGLAAIDPAHTVWSFTGPQPAAWWLRRQVHENAVHGWDAQSAIGTPQPLPVAVAVDGVDEYIDVFLPRLDAAAFGGAGESLLLVASDTPATWRFTFTSTEVVVSREADGGNAADAVVTASASDLNLVMWSRVGPADLEIAGDPELLSRFQAASSI